MDRRIDGGMKIFLNNTSMKINFGEIVGIVVGVLTIFEFISKRRRNSKNERQNKVRRQTYKNIANFKEASLRAGCIDSTAFAYIRKAEKISCLEPQKDIRDYVLYLYQMALLDQRIQIRLDFLLTGNDEKTRAIRGKEARKRENIMTELLNTSPEKIYGKYLKM